MIGKGSVPRRSESCPWRPTFSGTRWDGPYKKSSTRARHFRSPRRTALYKPPQSGDEMDGAAWATVGTILATGAVTFLGSWGIYLLRERRRKVEFKRTL